MSFKKCKVIALVTENHNKALIKNDNRSNSTGKFWETYKNPTAHFTKEYLDSVPAKHYHLYTISDDEIKEGDWCFDTHTKAIYKAHNTAEALLRNCKKIIATTDISLPLPQPSRSFIEKYIETYNSGNIIEDVFVEYENTQETVVFENGMQEKSHRTMIEKLKINPKDSTITIKKLKESWNKEEILSALNNPYAQGSIQRDEYRARVLKDLGLD